LVLEGVMGRGRESGGEYGLVEVEGGRRKKRAEGEGKLKRSGLGKKAAKMSIRLGGQEGKKKCLDSLRI